MIKCNHCGNMTPAGAVCQSCGTPLAIKVDDGFSPRMSAQDQPELPAWLESLRAGERSGPPANSSSSSSNFSTADFIEEGSLPNWMRAERNDTHENTADHAPVSALPDPSAGNGAPALEGITAQSLIDEKSLPSWMQEGMQRSTPPNPGGLSASSLVQQDNVPDWMKSLQQPSGPASVSRPNPQMGAPVSPAQPSNPVAPQGPSSLTPGFSARDLIDQQALPSWMQSANGQVRGMTGPDNTMQNQAGPFNPAPAEQGGFSASSLLDVNALPQWLRDGSQGKPSRPVAGNAGAEQSAPAQPAQSSWNAMGASSFAQQASDQPYPYPSPQNPPVSPLSQQEGGALSASSFIDVSALPQWLRTGSDPLAQPQQGMSAGSQQGPASIPPRAENMRVPSRPRGEANPTESSELAANVFASMLGVASATPNYPAAQQGPANAANSYQKPQPSDTNYLQSNQINQSGQQANPYGQMGQPESGQLANPYGQMSQSGQQANLYGQLSQSGLVGQMGQGVSPQASQSNIPNPGSVPNTPSQMGGAYSQGYGNSMSGVYNGNLAGNNQNQGNPLMSGMPQYPGNGSPMPNPSQAQSYGPNMGGDQRNNKKRGIFEAIRDWLSR